MSVVIICPDCNRELHGPETMLGTKVRCAGCQTIFVARSGGDEEEKDKPRKKPVDDERPLPLPPVSKLVSPTGTPINPKKIGKMIDLFGEDETEPGFVNYSTDPKYAVGNNGVTRPWTYDPQRPPGLKDKSASDICIRSSPLSKITLDEIERIAMPGCRVTIALNTDPEDDKPGRTNAQLQGFRDRFPTRTTLFDAVHHGVTDLGTPTDRKVIVAELEQQTPPPLKATLAAVAELPATPIARVLEVQSALPQEITNSIGMKFRLIPAGTFRLGPPDNAADRSADEGPVHEVTITQPFYLGIHQVTQEQFEKVMGKNPSYFSSTGGGKDKVRGLDTRSFPVEQVSWHDAQTFLELLSALPQEKEKGREYRLPSEVEWEYSCRGGASSRAFHFGNSLSSRQANFDGRYPYGEADKGQYLERTCQVGSYPANGFGLFDLHGNVSEWCQDWSDEGHSAASQREDSPGPSAGVRGIRGGGWNDGGDCCGTYSRSGIAPSNRGYDLGFRVALFPSESESR
jgi:formylglycine-generating enzyme required for sulfatase activity